MKKNKPQQNGSILGAEHMASGCPSMDGLVRDCSNSSASAVLH